MYQSYVRSVLKRFTVTVKTKVIRHPLTSSININKMRSIRTLYIEIVLTRDVLLVRFITQMRGLMVDTGKSSETSDSNQWVFDQNELACHSGILYKEKLGGLLRSTLRALDIYYT